MKLQPGLLGLTGGKLGATFPLGIGAWVPEGSLPFEATHSLTCAPVGGWTQILMGSLCQAVVAVKRHSTANISVLEQNLRTISVSKSHSTPSGHTWPTPAHNLTMSSSWKELEWSRVPSMWVAARMQMQFAMLGTTPGVGSCATKVVTVDLVEILKW